MFSLVMKNNGRNFIRFKSNDRKKNSVNEDLSHSRSFLDGKEIYALNKATSSELCVSKGHKQR